ncbi:acyl-CoA thioesterase domain-containing protein [Nocardia sp. NPDC005366]|uniref:acyl-CoA thioesterase n=1 Tax=Nocardia sp. NPDC005366 TaxID=3156878 RepID=UPI0033BDA8ED
MSRISRLLTLDRVDDDHFRAHPAAAGPTRVFGGQLAAQALMAAGLTVADDRVAHSLHCYFHAPGDPVAGIDYLVTTIRDGRSFSGRRVEARQGDRVIFSVMASFQRPTPGQLEHRPESADVRPPEESPPPDAASVVISETARAWFAGLGRRHPIEFRLVEGAPFDPRRTSVPRMWMRLKESLGADVLAHAAAAAYASDQLLLGAAAFRHGIEVGDPGLVGASLDHAVWFHESFRTDEWFLYEVDSAWAAGGRALSTGRIFDRSGRLVVSAAQEGVMRPVTATADQV